MPARNRQLPDPPVGRGRGSGAVQAVATPSAFISSPNSSAAHADDRVGNRDTKIGAIAGYKTGYEASSEMAQSLEFWPMRELDSNLQYRGKIDSSFEASVALGEGRVPAMPRGPHTWFAYAMPGPPYRRRTPPPHHA